MERIWANAYQTTVMVPRCIRGPIVRTITVEGIWKMIYVGKKTRVTMLYAKPCCILRSLSMLSSTVSPIIPKHEPLLIVDIPSDVGDGKIGTVHQTDAVHELPKAISEYSMCHVRGSTYPNDSNQPPVYTMYNLPILHLRELIGNSTRTSRTRLVILVVQVRRLVHRGSHGSDLVKRVTIRNVC